MNPVPAIRVHVAQQALPRQAGEYVLYWMIAQRRVGWNFALQRSVEWANRLQKPLLVFEPLRCDYRWASDRLHRFVIEGMANHVARFAGFESVRYFPYVEPRLGDGKGLLAALSERAAVVVTDDFPSFFLPRMVRAAAARSPVRFEQVDSNGLYPLQETDRCFTTAASFRRHLHKTLRPHLESFPAADPLSALRAPRAREPAKSITDRWPEADLAQLLAPSGLARLPIDHTVTPAPFRGGTEAGRAALAEFLNTRLDRYPEDRNHPDEQATSELSPYLHFGHIASPEVFQAITAREDWTLDRLAKRPTGGREGWWGASPAAEAVIDQLVTWRELGFNTCARRDDYAVYESLPTWAKATLSDHARDARPHLYDLGEFERAETHDELWNAAQRQLVREGRLHNYLRMLWGKKILEWSASPREALATMIELNNKYAVDGRNPNSYSGIFWILGRYDRAWGPERPIFGKVRYMSSENTRRKLRLSNYLARYSAPPR